MLKTVYAWFTEASWRLTLLLYRGIFFLSHPATPFVKRPRDGGSSPARILAGREEHPFDGEEPVNPIKQTTIDAIRRATRDPDLRARFLSRTDERSEDECWPWTGTRTATGYGQIAFHGRQQLAHHVALSLDGRIQPDYIVSHLCGNRLCVNPKHMRLTDAKGNKADGRRLGENESHPLAKLTKEKVAEIFALHRAGQSQKAISERFGIHPQYVSLILSGRRWGHLGLHYR